MNHRHSRPTHSLTAAVFALACAAALLLMPATSGRVAAASCNGASHAAPVLSAGKATPGSGTPSTTIKFTVRYADAAGCAPSRVSVVITGVGRFVMSAAGNSWKTGVTFSASRKLPAGTWSYRFEATSGTGAGKKTTVFTAVAPTHVSITAPTPKPTPKPTPRPTPGQPRDRRRSPPSSRSPRPRLRRS